MEIPRKTIAAFRHLRAPRPGNGPKYVAGFGCLGLVMGSFLLIAAGKFWALIIIPAPFFIHARYLRRSLASQGPFTGNEMLDGMVRDYIVPLALLNGILLAGLFALATAGNQFWVLLAFVATPLLVLQIVVWDVTLRQELREDSEDDVPEKDVPEDAEK